MNTDGEHVQKEHDYDNTRGFKTPNMIEKKRLKSSPEQLAFLIDYMNKHPDLARGFPCGSPMGKLAIEKHWQGLTKKLNSLRGPSKSIAKWKQAWRDFRHNLKKRAAGNFKELEAYRRYRLKSNQSTSLDVIVSDLDPEVSFLSDDGDNIQLIFTEESTPNPEDTPMIINMPIVSEPSHNDQIISAEHERTSPLLTPKVEAPDPEIPSDTEAPAASEISTEVQAESPSAIASPKASEPSARKRRIARRLGSLLKLEESKIQIQKERNRILAQKNTISAEKVGAINRLTDVLQAIANNFINS